VTNVTSKATVGKVLGALGLLSLLSAPYTYFVTGSGPLTAFKAVLGVLLIGSYFASNYGQLNQFASRRSTFYVASSVLLALGALAALGFVNYIAAKKNKTWDLTSKKVFTLAPQTQKVLAGLKTPVTAFVFLPPTDPDYAYVDRLLARYHAQAPERFGVVFKDPRKAPELTAKYQLHEGQTTIVLSRGTGDQEQHTTVSVAPLQGVTEQDVTNGLLKLDQVGERHVYFVTGHGEWPLEPSAEGTSLSEMRKSLFQEGYQPLALNLMGNKAVPKDASLLILAGSRSKLAKPELEQLQAYLLEGGRMLVFVDALLEPGLETLLAPYGVQVDPGIVADEEYGVGSPYIVATHFYGDQDMVRELARLGLNVQFPTSRGLTVLAEGLLSGARPEAVVTTSSSAWEELDPGNEPKKSPGERAGNIPLVVAVSRPVPESNERRTPETRLVVFGDSEILLDPNWRDEPNRNLVMNALAWASGQPEQITVRAPDRDISSLDLDTKRLGRIRFLATDFLPLALLGAGLAVWLTRRNK
jgi:ABC-type uncharacterized transport system involved in gliding motility auxiliary subunit